MWPCLDSTVTFLSSISFGTDRTLPTTLSFHSFLPRRSLGSSVSRESLFSFDSITTITAGCPRGTRESIYTRNTITTRLSTIAARRSLCLISRESICLNLIIKSWKTLPHGLMDSKKRSLWWICSYTIFRKCNIIIEKFFSRSAKQEFTTKLIIQKQGSRITATWGNWMIIIILCIQI